MQIAATIRSYTAMSAEAYAKARAEARRVAEAALWERLIIHYRNAYEKALLGAAARTRRQSDQERQTEQLQSIRPQPTPSRPSWTRLIVEVSLPERLRPLAALAKNLWWSWTLDAHELFSYIDPEQWDACSRNPITLLDQLSCQTFILNSIEDIACCRNFGKTGHLNRCGRTCLIHHNAFVVCHHADVTDGHTCDDDVAAVKCAVLDKQCCHRTAAFIQTRFDDSTFCQTVRVCF